MSIGQTLVLILLFLTVAACVASAQTPTTAATPADYWVYLSSSAKDKPTGIYLYKMNLATGALTPKGVAIEAPDPNFLALSADNRFMYASTNTTNATTHQSTGFATAFSIDAATGKLKLINSQPSAGLRAVHVSIDPSGHTLLVANYQGNTVAALGINPDGSLMPANADGVQTHTGSGPNPTRQLHPYLHSIYPDPSGQFAYACDLGTDQIHIYALDAEKHTLKGKAAVKAPPGCGPRHFTFAPDGKHAYLVTEMGNTVIAYDFNSTDGTLTQKQIVSTLPADLPKDILDKQTGAEIHIHPNGKFLYASNRGPHSSIAVFAIDPADGTLKRIDDTLSGGLNPRYFGIDPTGSFLFAGNQNSDTVLVFRIDAFTGKLTPTGTSLPIPGPMCFAFVPVQQ